MTTITDRPGGSLSRRAKILNSHIPQGGFGRPLTSTELASLRAVGWTVSRGWHVIRQVSDIPNLGIVYKPARGSGMDHAGIYVETK